MNIGILLVESGQHYSQPLMAGVYDYCTDMGIGLTVFPFGRFNSPHEWEQGRDFLFDFIDSRNIDGLISISSALTTFTDTVWLEEKLKEIGDLPIVSLVQPLSRGALIKTDLAEGFSELIDHLINHHGYRRFGFIGGPESNIDARDRYRLFRELLSVAGIPFNESNYRLGTYEIDSGRSAAGEFIDDGSIEELEVIVCANDLMALGAWQELQGHGYRIPSQVALTGFDNIPFGRYCENPLTTVDQRVRDAGRQAARLLHHNITDTVKVLEEIVPTKSIIRGSCGCMTGIFTDENLMGDLPLETVTFLNDSIVRVKKELGVIRASDELEKFRNQWSSLVIGAIERGVPFYVMYGLLDSLRNSSQIERGDDPLIEQVLLSGGLIIYESINRTEFLDIRIDEFSSHRLDQFGARVISAAETERLGSLIEEELTSLGVSVCMVGRFLSEGIPDKRIHPILCYREGGIPGAEQLDSDGAFESGQLLPDGFRGDESESLIVLPLNNGKETLGVAVLDFEPSQIQLYIGIRTRLSMALKVAANLRKLESEVEQRRLAEEELSKLSLKDELTGLYNRRGFHILTEEQLKKAGTVGKPYAIVYADMDELKLINDNNGHAAGDIALKDAAAALSVSVRDSDIVARLGGDEFGLFVLLDKLEHAQMVKIRLEKAVAEADSEGRRKGREWETTSDNAISVNDFVQRRILARTSSMDRARGANCSLTVT